MPRDTSENRLARRLAYIAPQVPRERKKKRNPAPGRPRLPESIRRSVRVVVCVTPLAYAQFEAIAVTKGLPVAIMFRKIVEHELRFDSTDPD